MASPSRAAAARRQVLELKWEPLEAGVEVLRECVSPVKSRPFEPAGHAFHTAALRQRGLLDGGGNDDEEGEDGDSGDDEQGENGNGNGDTTRENGIDATDSPLPTLRSRTEKGGKKKGGAGKKKRLDYYALLGLEHERYLATEKDIQRAYKDTALKYHPDKRGAAVAEEKEKERIEERFKAIQEAYEHLSNPEKRRLYDSTDEFDDTLPTPNSYETDEGFFSVFGAAFKRQSKWSVKKKVPELGDKETSMDVVDAFYDFWFTFKSWREFPSEDEFDLESAECRMDKRWMERQNAKMRERAKKDEEKRLRMFVETAYSVDPRVVARKKREREEKQARKKAIADAKQKELDAIAQKEREEKEASERAAQEAKEAASSAKKQREKEKKLLRKERSRLRSIHGTLDSGAESWPDWDVIEGLCNAMATEELRHLCDQLEHAGDDAEWRCHLINDSHKCITDENQREREDRLQAAIAAAEKKQIEEEEKAKEAAKQEALLWTEEEIRLLDKAVAKYPMGTRNRWEMVAKLVRTKTIEEVIRYTKYRQSCGEMTQDKGSAYDQFLQNRKSKNNDAGSIASPASIRDDDNGNDVNGSVAESSAETNGGGNASATTVEDSKTPADETISNAAPPSAEEEKQQQSVWSKMQELALVSAMKKYSKDAADRWGQIATAVPGKSKSECYTRYQELRKTFKKTKGK